MKRGKRKEERGKFEYNFPLSSFHFINKLSFLFPDGFQKPGL